MNKLRGLLLELHLVELQALELHFPLLTLAQETLHLLPLAVEECVVDAEVAEHLLLPSLHTDLSIPKYRVVSVIGHPSEVWYVLSPRLLFTESVALIVGHWHQQSSLVHDFLVLVDVGVVAGKDSIPCPDNHAQTAEAIDIEMEAVLVPGVVLVQEDSPSDPGLASIVLKVADEHFLTLMILAKEFLIEERSAVWYIGSRYIVFFSHLI